jgi:hypothetical protein
MFACCRKNYVREKNDRHKKELLLAQFPGDMDSMELFRRCGMAEDIQILCCLDFGVTAEVPSVDFCSIHKISNYQPQNEENVYQQYL